MLLPAHETGYLDLPDGARLPYLKMGDGHAPLVLIPGAGDGMMTVVDGARRLALYYRKRVHAYHMLIISRRQPISPGFTVEQHADDVAWALRQLEWEPSVIESNSAGGPVAQWLAVKYPGQACSLILSSTLHRADENTRAVLQSWIDLARQRKWSELNKSSIEYTFRPDTVSMYKPVLPLIGLMPKPRYPERLERILEGLLALDNRAILPQITCPTLVIGGKDDRVISAAIQREMADLIPNSELILYSGYGHGNDQENTDYERQVARFVHQEPVGESECG